MRLPVSLKLHCFVFLGAFLLLTMEPLVARVILPVYGGSFHVWTTTLTFFQGILFFGYLYCHLISSRLGGWHLVLVATPLVWLPLVNQIGITPPRDGNPVWFLMFQLTLHVALPFGILATTSVIAQSWFIRSETCGSSPYTLYASSNAGSLLALLAYIALCEPLFGLSIQRSLWYAGYISYVALAWYCWRITAHTPKEKNHSTAFPSSNIKAGTLVSWLLLSALPSAFMLAVSNAITLELGSVPLVWVLPLALYLLSYVFTFSQKQWIPPTLLHAFWPAAAIWALCILYSPSLGYLQELVAHLVALFAIAMVGHGELHRLRPSRDQLTVFYLTIALGGWIGGMAVSLVSPAVFNSLTEYPIIIGVFAITILILKKGDLLASVQRHPKLSISGVVLAVVSPFLIGTEKLKEENEVILQYRNYYGIYKVADHPLDPHQIFPDWSEKDPLFSEKAPILRTLWHGSTVHGAQIMHPYTQKYPISYYHGEGPLKDVFGETMEPRNAAIIGLGVGACSTYFKEGESITFYELDPSIVKIAQNNFTYLTDCPANVEMVTGDARIQLEQAPDHSYDIIMVDAFSSDAIPTHLLTKEAFNLYEQKLAPQGKLVFHITNRYYDLLGVIKSTSAERWKALAKQSNEKLKPFQDHSLYCVLHRKSHDGSSLRAANWLSLDDYLYECSPWSDDYINTLRPLYIMLRSKY